MSKVAFPSLLCGCERDGDDGGDVDDDVDVDVDVDVS